MVSPLLIFAVLGLLSPPVSTLASDSWTAEFPLRHAIVKFGEKELKFVGLKSQENIVRARLREAELVKNNPVALKQTLIEASVELAQVENEGLKQDLSRKNVEVLTALRDKLPLAVTNKSVDKCPLGSVGYGTNILRGC